MITLLQKAWHQHSCWLILLLPLSWLYGLGQRIHRFLYESGLLKRTAFDVPVIVVGNIMAGGTGKTPVVIALAKQYAAQGKKVGIISRGYGARAAHYPLWVKRDDDPAIAGDEPVLLAESTTATVMCDPDRVRGVRALIDAGCDLIISDDGLQHYPLKPSKRIVVHPADWQGATALLPAGPFREPLSRLAEMDEVLYLDNTHRRYVCTTASGEAVDIQALPSPIHVVVGIAQPERLFRFLEANKVAYQPHVFPDHHPFIQADFREISGPVLMTHKDWVKCRRLAWNAPVYIIHYEIALFN